MQRREGELDLTKRLLVAVAFSTARISTNNVIFRGAFVDVERHEQASGELPGAVGPIRRWLTSYFRRRVRNPSDVDEMVQEVFARIVARDSTEEVRHLGGYILKTAASVLADRARRLASRMAGSHIAFDPDYHGGEEIDPERVLSGKEELRAATMALLSLPERTRTVFILHRLEGHKHRDIALRLGISVSAVEKHFARAIAHLSLEMEKRRGS